VASVEYHTVSAEEHTVIVYLLRERISLRGICRVVGVSLTWLLRFMAEGFAACPDHLDAQLPVGPIDVVIRRLEAEADEMWSFVGKKANKPWIWIAMDANTRQVIAFHIGGRSRESGAQLWAKVPEVYRRQDEPPCAGSLSDHGGHDIPRRRGAYAERPPLRSLARRGYLSARARYTLSAVIGRSRMRTPTASSTALAMAGATGPTGFSPMPFAW
jgi:hypothetical protein